MPRAHRQRRQRGFACGLHAGASAVGFVVTGFSMPVMPTTSTDAPAEAKHFVFDFGGVLFQWRPIELLQRCLPRRAHDGASARHWVEQIFQDFAGDWGEFDRGTVSVDELARRIAARTGLLADEVHAVVAAVPDELQPLADSVALLRRLRDAGHRLFYLSNMPLPFAEHLEREYAFLDWFDRGVFSSRVRHIKPEPPIFELAARRFGVAASRLMFFDDSARNVRAARAAGWHALQFVDAADCQRRLRAAGWD